ncbi:uncharacterized protein LOC119165640 isoform X2 [Rhipicephalus microplus]|uniref:uncharacterized protein LOC119165640 isoform X2 n=1 Tax=Rhipicephalus microplus TaxID=6941 RepID=UPI003F6C6745
MCICETAFEVSILAAVCLLYNGLNIFVLLQSETRGVAEYVLFAYLGGSAVIALVLLLGAMSGNKKMVDTFVCFAKVRLVLYCVLAGFLAYEIFGSKNGSKSAKGRGFVHQGIFIPYLLARLPAMMAKDKEKPVFKGFVIYRVQVFSDKLGPPS